MQKNKKSILLVEDNPSDVDLTRIALTSEKIAWEVNVVWDGVEAIEYLFGENRNVELPDIVLLDLKLPRVDGFSVLDRIRNSGLTKNIPVIVLTTSNDQKTIDRSFQMGANAFVHKSAGFKEFCQRLAEAIRKHVPGMI